jgi:hypothetical protein
MISRGSATSDRSAVRHARALAVQDIERCYRNWTAPALPSGRRNVAPTGRSENAS